LNKEKGKKNPEELQSFSLSATMSAVRPSSANEPLIHKAWMS